MADPRLDRRLGALAIGAGAILALAVQLAGPVVAPLYDGVVVQEPYRYLHPTGDQPGDPGSFAASPPVVGGVSPEFAAATTENPPQAQLVAQRGAFALTPGATTLQVSITAIEAPEAPPGSAIAGNVYRILVTDQAGTTLTVKPCDGCLTLSMRAPQGTTDATMQRFTNGSWTELETLPVGLVSVFQANLTAVGDIALVTSSGTGPGTEPGTTGGLPGQSIDPVVFFGVGAVLLWLLVFGFVVWTRLRPAPTPGSGSAKPRNRIPSKQRAPRPPKSPPAGRSDK